jgi:hypothetical protein
MTPGSTDFSKRIRVSGPIVSTSSISCVSLVQTSDSRIKSDFQDPSEDLQRIFDGASVYSYDRDDVEGRRVGFLAQEIQANVPKEICNLVFMSYERDQPLLAIDYSRLVTVLWATCKNLQKRIEALENPKKRSKKATA